MKVWEKKPEQGRRKRHISLLITGVPSTGKSTLALDWCEKNTWAYLSLNDLVEEKKLYTQIDQEDMSKIVRMRELEAEANEWIAMQDAPSIVDGHLGCEIKLDVDAVLVLRLNPKELQSRLEKRGYTPTKVDANKMAEMLDYCTIRSIKNYGEDKVFEMDMSGKSLQAELKEFEEFVKSGLHGANFRPHVSWSEELLGQA